MLHFFGSARYKMLAFYEVFVIPDSVNMNINIVPHN